jgi:hypothetical protein
MNCDWNESGHSLGKMPDGPAGKDAYATTENARAS